jgi:dinuclear metal center YbgI/SA1388 family protein
MKVKDVLSYLESLYPPDTACDFDNVGLLVGDGECGVTAAVITLDCDVNAVSFAKENGANLIITHHPVILEPLKSVTAGSIVFRLIKEGISVISMHTNLDVGDGGVNDALCAALGLTDIKPYTAGDGYLLKSGKTDKHKPNELALHIKERLGGAVRYTAGKKDNESVLVCSGSGGS